MPKTPKVKKPDPTNLAWLGQGLDKPPKKILVPLPEENSPKVWLLEFFLQPFEKWCVSSVKGKAIGPWTMERAMQELFAWKAIAVNTTIPEWRIRNIQTGETILGTIFVGERT